MTKIDVLRVMDAVANYMQKKGMDTRHAPMLREARDAVAELMSAAASVGMNRFSDDSDEFSHALGLLESALSNMSGE